MRREKSGVQIARSSTTSADASAARCRGAKTSLCGTPRFSSWQQLTRCSTRCPRRTMS